MTAIERRHLVLFPCCGCLPLVPGPVWQDQCIALRWQDSLQCQKCRMAGPGTVLSWFRIPGAHAASPCGPAAAVHLRHAGMPEYSTAAPVNRGAACSCMLPAAERHCEQAKVTEGGAKLNDLLQQALAR